jgi:hypothetical protein
MGLAATIGQSTREAGDLARLAEANSSRLSGLKEAVRFTAERRSQVAMFQQKTPEVSALVTVFLVGSCEIYRKGEIWGERENHRGVFFCVCGIFWWLGGRDLLAFAVVVLVGGEHYVGRVEGEVIELGVAWKVC